MNLTPYISTQYAPRDTQYEQKNKPKQTQFKPNFTRRRRIQTQNKPNLVRRLVHRSFNEGGSLGEGGFKPNQTQFSAYCLAHNPALSSVEGFMLGVMFSLKFFIPQAKLKILILQNRLDILLKNSNSTISAKILF
jgi:hypothetical protein